MAHVATITIDYTKVPGDLTDYVGLIVPDGSAGYAELYALCLEGGGDIRLFKSDDTTELAREVVTFSASAETGEIHYRYAGTLSSSVDTDIHVYADGSSADYAVTATYGRNNVWTDYRGVWHMQADGTDSTGNLNNTDNSLSFAAAKIGSGATYNANGDRVTTTTSTGSANVYSIDTWAKWTASTAFPIFTWTDTGGDTNSGYQILLQSTTAGKVGVLAGPTSATTVNNGAWHKITVTGNGPTNAGEIFIDGASDVTGTAFNFGATNLFPMLGRNAGAVKLSWNGELDEMRWRLSILSANWITTEYNNQNSPTTFYSVAAVGGGSAAQAARRGVIMMM